MTGTRKGKNEERKRPLIDRRDRELIANALDDTLIVEAAAGTGKTTELIQRIVRVLEAGTADVTEIACVTFTERAAGELKLRLRETIEEARNTNSRMSAAAGRLDSAVARLEEAHVNTIHGFCADLLRERPVEARIDPLFSVLTEGQARRLYDAAFQSWFQERLSDPPEGIRRSLRRPTFAGFGPFAEANDGPVDRLRNAGWELEQWRDFEAGWQRPPFAAASRIDELVDRLHEFASLSDHADYQYDSLYLDTRPARQLSEEVTRTERVIPRDYARLEAALVELGRNRQFQRARKGSGKYKDGVARDAVARAREQLQAELNRFEVDANADLAALLCAELRACSRRYEEAKAKAGALDFLDLLLKARNLVRDNLDVRRSFQRRFKRIFVDEFQDTDPLQAEILLLLAADDPSVQDWRKVHPIPGKLFIVGDPKQSIYRFRRADVTIYREVYDQLEAAGAKRVSLSTSFRARPNMQRAINRAFEPAMTVGAQPGYVALEPFRADIDGQPSVIVLPVPEPYGSQRIANSAVEVSLPDAVGAFVQWMIHESGWKVAERPSPLNEAQTPVSSARGFQPGERERLVPVQARHVCLLFRRFVSWDQDVTRPYVRSLEARGIPHLLVGGRSFHNRSEIESLRAALAAVEWPDDELSVFATLRGTLFAIGDEELLEFRHRAGVFHPFRIPKDAAALPDRLTPVVSALTLLQSLHRSRNYVPVSTTIARLLDATRAHVRFALEHGGEQVLANVLHVAELARRYESEGGISFRGFIEELREQAEDGQSGEAPILEEASDGVRMMTVHKAKGLEFPVVILADMTAKLRPAAASRYLNPSLGVCAVRIAGCSPADLMRHEAEELQCDEAEGVRLAYVAATRARDLLVIPAVGDEERDGWIDPLNRAIYPPASERRQGSAAPGCPPFRTRDSVLSRPNGDPALPKTVAPGLHTFQGPGASHSVVWWDPAILSLGAEAPLGIRWSDLIVKDVEPRLVEEGLADYTAWSRSREAALADGRRASITVQPVSQAIRSSDLPSNIDVRPFEIVELSREHGRPSGARFGSLVHAVLATMPLDGDRSTIDALTASHGRILGATAEETRAASALVQRVLDHGVLRRARKAAEENNCRREVPVSLRGTDGQLIEGVVDLVFREGSRWTIVDFKTHDDDLQQDAHAAQLSIYGAAIQASTGQEVTNILMRI